MPGPHDPNHTSGAGLALRDEGEETAHPTPTKEKRPVKGSHTKTRFWLGIAVFLLGLAALVTGFIFYPGWSGALTAEYSGAGVALVALLTLLFTRAWRGASKREITKEELQAAPPDLLAEPAAPTALIAPALPAEASSQPTPATTTVEPPNESVDAPSPERAPEVSQMEARVAAPPPDAPASEPAAPEPTPASTTAPPPAPKPTSPDVGKAAQNGHNGHAPPTALPRTRARPTPGVDPSVPPPPLTGLSQRFPAPIKGYATDAEEISELLGNIAEQTVMAVATRGKRGLERRERMAARIEAFRQEMAVDPNYQEVAAFLEAIVALLRAGKIIPASTRLEDPFDEFYEYVLTLIRRKTGQTQD